MTKKQHDMISTRLRAARESVAPVLGRYPIPPGKTTTLCNICHREVYRMPGLTVDTDGQRHDCPGTPPHDTTPPPPRGK